MMKTTGMVVLVTGASSGIGKATADFLMRKGLKVYGTSRKAPCKQKEGHDAFDGASGGTLDYIPLDVNSDESVLFAIDTVIKAEGRIDILVSNAGTGVAGSVEDTSVEESKKQFETNFFGSLRVIRALLPIMRKQGFGKIVVLSSVAGVISIPYQSMYSASKFALEGLVEALRLEVESFGIKACLVLPGDTKTGFTACREIAEQAKGDTPYSKKFKQSLSRMEKDEQNGVSPYKVAAVIYSMIKRKNPPVRKTVGFGYKLILFLRKLLPAGLVEKFVKMLYA